MMRPISEDGFLVEYGDSTDTLRRSYNVPILLTFLGKYSAPLRPREQASAVTRLLTRARAGLTVSCGKRKRAWAEPIVTATGSERNARAVVNLFWPPAAQLPILPDLP